MESLAPYVQIITTTIIFLAPGEKVGSLRAPEGRGGCPRRWLLPVVLKEALRKSQCLECPVESLRVETGSHFSRPQGLKSGRHRDALSNTCCDSARRQADEPRGGMSRLSLQETSQNRSRPQRQAGRLSRKIV